MPGPKRERVRRLILKKAAVLCARHGIERVTMDQIAREAQLTRTAVYYYFSSKEAVLQALWRLGWRMLYRAVEPYESMLEDDPMTALARAIEREYELFRRRRALLKTLFRMSAHRDTAIFRHPDADRDRRRYLEFHRRVLETGIQKGVFRPVDIGVALRAIHGIIIGFLTFPISDDRRIDSELIIEVVRRFLA